MSLELEKDLSIDPNRLDAEWIKLPGLYFKYREEADYLDSLARKKKMQIEYEGSQLDASVRLDPRQYLGVEKPTEAQVRCFIEGNENIFKLKEEMFEIEKKKKLVISACSSLEMKRDALKNLVQLLNGEYFSTKRIDGVMTPFVDNEKQTVQRNIRREIRGRMNKKKENE